MMKKIVMLLTALCIMVMSSVAMAAMEGTDISDGYITVQGYGALPPQAVNPAQARMMARRAAMVDGYRQLAEAVQGVNVDSQTTVQNMLVTSDVINTRVSAVIKGAQVVSEQVIPDGGYEVTMRVAVFGAQNSLAAAVLPPSAQKEAFPAVGGASAASAQAAASSASGSYNATNGGSSAADPRSAASMNVQVQGTYTGVIIDCSGLGLHTAMSPVIMTEGGQKIYGYKNLDYQKVIAKGMAGYVDEGGSSPRCGNNPLRLNAVNVDNGANPVLSQADADKMLLENQRSHFLDECNVVFVR